METLMRILGVIAEYAFIFGVLALVCFDPHSKL